MVDAVFYIHDKQPHILYIGRQEGTVVWMDKTHIMAPGTLLALLSKKFKHVVLFADELCKEGVATERGDAGVLDERERLHITSNLRYLILEELHGVHQVEHYSIVHDAMEEVNESRLTPEHCKEGVAVEAEKSGLLR